ncbi:MAG: phosphatase PAP2 family protein [Hungatella sp.]|jgi:membrane-associated phospholipid phosphatase|nr:phosphatase PAP2 family protein [Hungatella sp.]
MADTLIQLDGAILLWIQEFVRNDVLTPLFTAVTGLGDKGFIWILLSLVLLTSKKTRETGMIALLGLLLSLLVINLALKNLVARERPFDMIEGLIPLIERPGDYSFPSGHSASSFAAAGVMVRRLPRWAGIPLFLLAVMISLLRLYVGVHYPTDVLAGVAIGLGLSYLAEWIWKRQKG